MKHRTGSEGLLGAVGRWGGAACVALGGFVPRAIAQAEAAIGEQPTPIKQWIAVLVFVGLLVAIACKNPKRSHQS